MIKIEALRKIMFVERSHVDVTAIQCKLVTPYVYAREITHTCTCFPHKAPLTKLASSALLTDTTT